MSVRESGRTERVLKAWLRARAEAVLSERMTHCLEHAARFGIHHDGAFRVRGMRTRWGSCTRNGQLTFNPLLIQAPKDCIDYVLLHELCHTVAFNHSPHFYALLQRVVPEWLKYRRKLNLIVEIPA